MPAAVEHQKEIKKGEMVANQDFLLLSQMAVPEEVEIKVLQVPAVQLVAEPLIFPVLTAQQVVTPEAMAVPEQMAVPEEMEILMETVLQARHLAAVAAVEKQTGLGVLLLVMAVVPVRPAVLQ